ncbi:MAG: class I SAM-dependent methyltransferase [Gammaproteobacteria bacterium]|nr:class I SAM-dependent methyltransferase [Gammaproteobacteria bacterium]
MTTHSNVSDSLLDPAAYDAWYHTARGRWIGDREFNLLRKLLFPKSGESLLDIGCGTGYFSRRFARLGLSATGIDPDSKAIEFAKGEEAGNITYLQGNALSLPFPSNSFDYTIAITSLCFIDDPLQALQEMWRVTDRSLVLGLLNRQSLLYLQKYRHGSYRHARWNTANEVRERWMPLLTPAPKEFSIRTAIFFPQGGGVARWAEEWIPKWIPLGGFLAVFLEK